MSENHKDLSKKLAIVLLALILILSEMLILYYATQKVGYHIDELWSFAHSNSSEGGFLYPLQRSGDSNDYEDVVYNHWVAPEKFWNYLTVQQGDAFNYANITDNLAEDVHPPLYYFLLHTVSSFFPETFSKWIGITPNLILFALVLLGLYQLSNTLTESRAKSLLICAVFGLSLAAVNMTIFIRSYLLLTLITVFLVSEISKLLLSQRPSASRLIKIFLLSVLGLLTHYYFIIFVFFLALSVGYYLFTIRQKKLIAILARVFLLTLISTALLSPNLLIHLFSSTRGDQAGFRAILGLVVLGYIAALVTVLRRIIRRRKNKELLTPCEAFTKANQALKASILNSPPIQSVRKLLGLTTLLTASVIFIVAPNMGVHSDRYYFNLMPILLILGIELLYSRVRLHKLESKNFTQIAAVLLILTLAPHLLLKSAYSFPNTDNRLRLNDDIQNAVCLLVSDQDYLIHNFSDVFFTADQVFVAREISNASIKYAFSELEQTQKITVIIDSRIPQTPEETTLLKDQTGYPLQFQYKGRHGTFLYRVYSLDDQP